MKGMQEDGIEAIQASGYKAVLVVTGGGSGAVHALLSHPGASRFILDVRIPYSAGALEAFLGHIPEAACSESTALELAEAAYRQASGFSPHALGIACTAALRTSRVRKGTDRAFFGIKSGRREAVRKMELTPGTRAEQEVEVSAALLGFIAAFMEVGP